MVRHRRSRCSECVLWGGETTNGVNPITGKYIFLSDLHTITSVSGFLDCDRNSISDSFFIIPLLALLPCSLFLKWHIHPYLTSDFLSPPSNLFSPKMHHYWGNNSEVRQRAVTYVCFEIDEVYAGRVRPVIAQSTDLCHWGFQCGLLRYIEHQCWSGCGTRAPMLGLQIPSLVIDVWPRSRVQHRL